MARFEPIATETPWLALQTTEEDWRAERPADLLRWLEQLVLIRRFEETVLRLHGEGLVHGPAHASIGQEAGAVGAMSVLGSADRINGTHRAHHQILAKLANHAQGEGYDPRAQPFGEAAATSVRRALAEIMGLEDGFCGGRGGSMHMRMAEAGIVGTSAIIGANLPHATGYGLADRLLGTGAVSVAFFGDGTLMAGAAYEAINLAALYRLPVIFFLENNLYAVSTRVEEQTRETRLTSRGPLLGVPAVTCDGMDVVAVRRAMQWARGIVEGEGGPAFVEARCYRFLHQSGPLEGSRFGYRDRAEEAAWRARDPLATMPARLRAMGLLDDAVEARLQGRVEQVLDAAVEALTEPAGDGRRVRPALWPSPAGIGAGIRNDLSELADARFLEAAEVPEGRTRTVRHIDAIAFALLANLERDPSVVVIGEDVHRLKGGVIGSTRGAVERFPDRVIATPICENGFLGMALGAALCGLRPVVDLMYSDFALVAADQLFNQIAKFGHMFGGGFPIPIVVRARVAPGTGYGSQHSMDPSGLFALYPGWRILSPATPHDYLGLMNAAVRCDDPVVIIDHQDLFQTTGPIPAGDRDYCVPIGRARAARRGTACTVITYAAMVGRSVEAAEAAGVDAEVIDLRTLDPLGLDWPLVEESVRRTNRVLVAEQTARSPSIGARIVQELQERCFDWLDHEILHVTGSHAAPVVSRPLNDAALGDGEAVAAALRRLAG